MKFYKISWEKYEKDCLALAKKLRPLKFDTYEIRETYKTFLKLFESAEKAKKKMLTVGFKEWEINTVLSY